MRNNTLYSGGSRHSVWGKRRSSAEGARIEALKAPKGVYAHWSDSIKHQTPEIRFIICRRCLVHIDKIGIFVSK